MKRKCILLIVALLVVISMLVVCGAEIVASTKYPEQTIKIISPTSAGGGYDRGTRLIAKYLPKYLPNKVDVVVENIPGGAQMIGVHAAYAAAPNGYTLLGFNSVGALMAQFIRPEDVKYDMTKFVYLGMWQKDVRAIGVNNEVTVQTWAELVKKSEEKPILTGTGGAGTGQHIDALMVEAVSPLRLKFIHYDGSAQVGPAMGRKEVEMEMAQVSTIMNLEDQKLGRLFCIFSDKRLPGSPNLPTALEVGMPKDEYTKLTELPFFGVDRTIVAPPGTDPAITGILRTALDKVFQDPEYIAENAKMRGMNNPMSGVAYAEVIVKKIQSAKDNKEVVDKLKF